MRPIDGDRLMMHLTDWWYSSFGQVETDESKAIKSVIDKIEQTLGEFALEKQERDRWIPVTERLPKCEQEVLICTKKKTYIHQKSGFEWCVNPIVTPAMYEDGTMLEVDSKWHWEYCDWAGWDEEEDCGIIPEGWWENSQFNPDGEYNHAIDVEVVAWRPLPEPYTEEES